MQDVISAYLELRTTVVNRVGKEVEAGRLAAAAASDVATVLLSEIVQDTIKGGKK